LTMGVGPCGVVLSGMSQASTLNCPAGLTASNSLRLSVGLACALPETFLSPPCTHSLPVMVSVMFLLASAVVVPVPSSKLNSATTLPSARPLPEPAAAAKLVSELLVACGVLVGGGGGGGGGAHT